MNSKFYFLLDLQVSQSQISIPVLLGDTAREWHISFADGGKAFFIEDGVLAKLEIKRPSGTFINEFCPIKNNTTVVYSFSQNTSTAARAGLHECNIVLYSPEGLTIASARFAMVVSARAINSDDINLSDEDLTAIDAIISAEAARVVAETKRVNAEALRVDAEEDRETNETARETAFGEAIAEVDNKIAEVDTKVANGDFDGFSPVVEVSTVVGGHKVDITDKDGEKSFTVLDGVAGTVAKYTIKTTLNTTDYKLTVAIKDENGTIVSTDTVDFPLESVVVGGDEVDGTVTLTLQNGNTISFYIGDLVDGLVTQQTYDADMERINTALGSYITEVDTLVGEGV